MIEVAELTVVAVAVTVPNITVAEEVKLVPVMVTDVPPLVGPLVGVMDVTVGMGGGGVFTNMFSMTISVKVDPTASQNVAEAHDTPLRLVTPEGRVWFVQVVPFHESATPPESM